MKKKSEKICPCGRIITDPKDKTGLCPGCKKTAGRGMAVVSLGVVGLLAKKYAPKAIKGISNLIKNNWR